MVFTNDTISDCVRRDASFRDRANIFLLVPYVFILLKTTRFFCHVITQTLSLMRVTPGLLSSRLLRGETGYLLLPQQRVLQAQFIMVVHKRVSQLAIKYLILMLFAVYWAVRYGI